MNFIGLLRTLEAITRPPRLGHDVDAPAETECLVPEDFNAVCRCVACVAEERAAEDELAAADDGAACQGCGRFFTHTADCPGETPNPSEPALTADELVGVRGLLQERYSREAIGCICPPGLIGRSVACRAHDDADGEMWRATAGMYQKMTSASNHTGTGAEPAPSPTIVQSAPPPTVDGEGPSACEHSPAPAEGRPPHPVPREQRQGTYCEDYETDGCSVDVCPDGCYHALKFRDDAAAEWIGEAVPVISAVLAKHYFFLANHSSIGSAAHCNCGYRPPGLDEWHEHVSPLIANALAPQDK